MPSPAITGLLAVSFIEFLISTPKNLILYVPCIAFFATPEEKPLSNKGY